MAPHSSTLTWKIPWTEEPGRLQSMGSDMTEQLHFHFSLSCTGEGSGNPLQCSCLENPRDGGAWWAAIYGVAQSQTRLKQLSRSSNNAYLSTTLSVALSQICYLSSAFFFSPSIPRTWTFDMYQHNASCQKCNYSGDIVPTPIRAYSL